jgi:hypothetical protein
MRSAALVPRHSAIGPSLRAMVRISEIVDGCGGGGAFAAAAAAPLPPLTAHSSGTGQARHGGASQLMKPHLLQNQQRAGVSRGRWDRTHAAPL